VPLARRGASAMEAGADLLVSIHLNTADTPAAEGVETYVLAAPGQPSTAGATGDGRGGAGYRHLRASMLLGYLVHRSVLEKTRAPDRGIRRARFQMLRESPCPAVLVEGGFLSNADEGRKLRKSSYREALAQGIARGIVDFVGQSAANEQALLAPTANP
jgi:N-acetylmuramoyl-L-alanine amidase